MSINKIALVGATGNLGPAILKGLLDNGYEVTVLSREGSTSTDSLPSHPKQTIKKVNFDDVNSIVSGLEGIEGMVSNVSSQALLSQKKMIDAAVTAGVQRFIPSDFGSDLGVEANRVPFNQPKIEIHDYLTEKVKTHPDFSYTAVTNGPFLDWCLKFGLFGDFKKHEMTLWDGGDNKFSTTTLASIGQAVAGVFKNLSATKNTEIHIADTTITQKELIEMAKEIDGQEWTTKPGSTAEAYQLGLAEFAKPQPNFMYAVTNQLYALMFATKHGVNFEAKLANDKVGLPVMTRGQVKAVVKSCMA